MVVLFKDGEELHMTSGGRLVLAGNYPISSIKGVDCTAKVHRTIDLNRKYSFMYRSVFYLYCGVFESIKAVEVQIEPDNKLFKKYQRIIELTGTINGNHGTFCVESKPVRTERTELGDAIKKFIEVAGITEINGYSSQSAIMGYINMNFYPIFSALDAVRDVKKVTTEK